MLTLCICKCWGNFADLCTYGYSRTLQTLHQYAAWTLMDTYKWYNYKHKYQCSLWLWTFMTVMLQDYHCSLDTFQNTIHMITWAQYSMNDLSSELNGLYAQLYITIFMSPHGVNKYTRLKKYTYIVRLWHDSVLQTKLSLVYTVFFHQSMSGWGNGEPGNYTHIISMPRNFMFYHIMCPFG